MDLSDPIEQQRADTLLRQQQHDELLRRQRDLTERQHAAHQQRLREDEERELIQRQDGAAGGSDSAEPSRESGSVVRRGWFGRHVDAPRANAKGLDDEDDDEPNDQHPGAPGAREPVVRHASGSGTSAGIWLIAVAVVAALGYFGWDRLHKERAPAAPVEALQVPAAALPLGDPAPSSAAAPSASDAPALDAEAPVATTPADAPELSLQAAAEPAPSPLADPVDEPQTDPVASASAQSGIEALRADEPAASEVPAAVETNAPVEEPPVVSAVAAPVEGGEAQVAALRERVAELEATVARLSAAEAAPATLPAHVAAPAPRPALRAQPAASKAAPKPIASATPAIEPTLLAIDMWDGQPSVVVGTNAPGDKRTIVLQPGDQLNGIQLRTVDPDRGTAIFSVQGGGNVTMRLGDSTGVEP